MTVILNNAPVEKIFVNGKKAEQLYNRYIKDIIGREAVCLPSTSPANAAWSLDRLAEAWSKELKAVEKITVDKEK